MIVNNIFLSSLSLLGLISPTSAQYVQHHQQVYIDGDQTDIKAKAIDGLPDEDKYIWTGTFKPPFLKSSERPLLVKLMPNQPINDPFAVDWAVSYYFPDADEPMGDSGITLDVQDVHYVAQDDEYILSGEMRKADEKRSVAFLLKTDDSGAPLIFKMYNQIRVFNSVVAKGKSKFGYVTVGETQPTSADVQPEAVFVSVDQNLDLVCFKQIQGDWKSQGTRTSSFNKVIRYGKKDFAAVGYTSNRPFDDPTLFDKDVLLATLTQKCEVKCNGRYGGTTYRGTQQKGDVFQYNEIGESLTEFKRGKNKGLLVTGRTEHIYTTTAPQGKSIIFFRDILLFRTLKTGSDCIVKFHKHFDISKNTDAGLAIETRKNINGKQVAVIAGESLHNIDKDTGNFVDTFQQDVVLLTINRNNGNPLSIELFGGEGFEGEMRGNLDLHLSHGRNFPIVLANSVKSWNFGPHLPYLIERYDVTKKQCFSADIKRKPQTYKFGMNPCTEKLQKTEVVERKLLSTEVAIQNNIICKKK